MTDDQFYRATEEIECPGCERSIPIEAENCPHCELALH